MPTTLTPLATLTPPCNARTWLSTPHPHLPLIATACSDKTVRIYSLRDFRLDSVVSGGHNRSIRSCAWKGSGSKGVSVLGTASFDSNAGIWKRWEEEGHARGAREDVSGLAGGEAEEEEAEEEWKFAVLLEGHDSEIKSLAFSPTGPLLATCSRDKSIWVWEELEDDVYETVAVCLEHEGDVKCVAWHPQEQLLASGSYDDSIRLWKEDVDDWTCCALLKGHEGTVWVVEFEDGNGIYSLGDTEGLSQEQKEYVDLRLKAGPRLISCSDDMTIRVWRRVPKEKAVQATGHSRTPSIWRNRDHEEEWVEEARLPQVHERAVYAVSWSKKTGQVVSTGSDGKIVVYQERWKRAAAMNGHLNGDVPMADGEAATVIEDVSISNGTAGHTEWVVVAEVDNAHDVFEVNHVVWATRADKGKRTEDEEVVVSTGDDGEVKVWVLDAS